MKKVISILLVLFHVSILFADVIIFNNGKFIKGKVIKINALHELNPNTGSIQEVFFEVNKSSEKSIIKYYAISNTDSSVVIFDAKDIHSIENDNEKKVFKKRTFSLSQEQIDSKIEELHQKPNLFKGLLILVGGSACVFILVFFWVINGLSGGGK